MFLSRELSNCEPPQGMELFTWRWERAERGKGNYAICCCPGTADPMAAPKMGPDALHGTLPPLRKAPYCWEHTWLDLDFGKTQQTRVI